MKQLQIYLQNEIMIPGIPSPLLEEVRNRLTISNPAYRDALTFGRSTRGISQYIRFYKSVGDIYLLPRGFLDTFTSLAIDYGYKPELIDQTVFFGAKKEIEPLPLRDYQAPWVDDLLAATDGIGMAPPAGGKTCMALEIYAKLGQPCIWLTHTKGLARQVAARLKHFTGEEAGIIGDSKEDIKHFTVGLIPTLARRDLSKYEKLFGLQILDEAHHAPAESFSTVSNAFWARHRYGLTATPYRDDGLEDLMFNTFGPIRASVSREFLRKKGFLMTPTVFRKATNFYFPYNSKSRKHGYKPMEAAMALDEDRNNLIVGDVLVEAFQEKNVCIVLVGRVEHGEILREKISQVYENVGLTHSKMPPKQAVQAMDDFSAGKTKILIATYRMLAEGFDYPPSNRLFLTAPYKGRTLIEQACGRVERISDGKEDARIYDYVDRNLYVLERQSEMRLDVYAVNKTPVVNLDVL